MYTLRDTIPSSVRRPIEQSRFAQGLMSQVPRPLLIAGPEARASALSKSRFARLPHEPEDARLTGVTRSLQRRLLALNVTGSLMRNVLVSAARIA